MCQSDNSDHTLLSMLQISTPFFSMRSVILHLIHYDYTYNTKSYRKKPDFSVHPTIEMYETVETGMTNMIKLVRMLRILKMNYPTQSGSELLIEVRQET